MDKFNKTKRSEIMSNIRSSNTEFERVIFRKLRKNGINFMKNYRGVIGKPDIALPRSKRAVFLHSDFWHGWQLPRWEKILPSSFWKNKLRTNRARDEFVRRKLKKAGWKVLTVREYKINHDLEEAVNKIINFLKREKSRNN